MHFPSTGQNWLIKLFAWLTKNCERHLHQFQFLFKNFFAVWAPKWVIKMRHFKRISQKCVHGDIKTYPKQNSSSMRGLNEILSLCKSVHELRGFISPFSTHPRSSATEESSLATISYNHSVHVHINHSKLRHHGQEHFGHPGCFMLSGYPTCIWCTRWKSKGEWHSSIPLMSG